MSVARLRAALSRHRPRDPAEAAHLAEILAFLDRHADPFDRGLVEGHLTGSALVVAADGSAVVLLHHRKLQRWLQPGGHGEPGEADGTAVALREAREETGLTELWLHPAAPRPLDVDVHPIPAGPREPAHRHLDLRYLVVAPPGAALAGALAEAAEARWFSWEALSALDLDHGLRRALAAARAFLPISLAALRGTEGARP